jgi:hypothetical protein
MSQKWTFAKDCKVKLVNTAKRSASDTSINKVFVVEDDGQSENLLTIKGYVDGHEMLLGFDTGATCSLISKKSAENLGLPYTESTNKFKSVDGIVRDVAGSIRNAKVTVSECDTELELMVIPHEDHDVLLGLDWFIATGAGLYPSLKLLRFPSSDVELHRGTRNSLPHDVDSFTAIKDIPDDPELFEDYDWTSEKVKFEPELEMSKEEEHEFYSLLNENKDMFAHELEDLATCTVGELDVDTGDAKPIFIRPYIR